MKVTAIDPITGREATIVGDAREHRTTLSKTAANKLEYLMNRDA